MTIKVNAKERGWFLTKKLLTSQKGVIFPRSKVMASLVRVLLPDNQNFLFYLTSQANLTFYSHIVHDETLKILVKNGSDSLFCIPCWYKLSHLLDITYNNCFLMDIRSVYDLAAILPFLHFFLNLSAGLILLPAYFLIETILNNGIRMYGDASTIKQISDLVAEYPSIGESQGFVQISSER